MTRYHYFEYGNHKIRRSPSPQQTESYYTHSADAELIGERGLGGVSDAVDGPEAGGDEAALLVVKVVCEVEIFVRVGDPGDGDHQGTVALSYVAGKLRNRLNAILCNN